MPGPASAQPSTPSSSTPVKRRYGLTGPELIEELRRCGAELGGPPSVAAFRRWAQRQDPHVPGPETILKRVGHWPDALRHAGFDADPERRSEGAIGDTEATRRAIGALQDFARDMGVQGQDAGDFVVAQKLNRGAYDLWRHEHAPGMPSVASVQAALGFWPAALHAAGLASTPERPRKTQVFPDEEILRTLRTAAAELEVGPRLGLHDYQAWRELGPGTGAPTGRLVWERFGSWAAALAQAGLTPEGPVDQAPEPAVDGLRRFLADGSPADVNPEAYLVWAAAQSTRQPKARAIIAEQGSWGAALQAAGATPPEKSPSAPAWENDDMLDALRMWALVPATGVQLNCERYRGWLHGGEQKLPTDYAISERFGGWRKALEAAGLEQRENIRDRFKPLAPNAIEDALVAFAEAFPDPDLRSQYRYGAWRAAEAPWAPSKRTLTLKFGSWPKVRERLVELDEERDPSGGLRARRRPTGHRRSRPRPDLPPLYRPAN